MWWKKGDGGFYDTEIENGVELTDEEWGALLEGQSRGKEIVEDENGRPVLRDPVVSLEDAKVAKLAALAAYDSSHEVNTCTVNGVAVWLDKASRSSMQLLCLDEESVASSAEEGTPEYLITLWGYEGPLTSVQLSVSDTKSLLVSLERYASEVFNVTHAHMKAISALDDVASVESYDFTVGYPEPLVMTFE